MHELSITQEIVRIVEETRSGADPEARVRRVFLRIGKLTGFVEDSVRHYYEILAEGTPLEGAEIVVEEAPLVLLCGECGKQTTPEAPVFYCGECGGKDTAIVSGRDLTVVSIELDP